MLKYDLVASEADMNKSQVTKSKPIITNVGDNIGELVVITRVRVNRTQGTRVGVHCSLLWLGRLDYALRRTPPEY